MAIQTIFHITMLSLIDVDVWTSCRVRHIFENEENRSMGT